MHWFSKLYLLFAIVQHPSLVAEVHHPHTDSSSSQLSSHCCHLSHAGELQTDSHWIPKMSSGISAGLLQCLLLWACGSWHPALLLEHLQNVLTKLFASRTVLHAKGQSAVSGNSVKYTPKIQLVKEERGC